jgi:hypothetical protein
MCYCLRPRPARPGGVMFFDFKTIQRLMTKLSFLPSLQKTRHPAAGGNTTYRLTVSTNSSQNQMNWPPAILLTFYSNCIICYIIWTLLSLNLLLDSLIITRQFSFTLTLSLQANFNVKEYLC